MSRRLGWIGVGLLVVGIIAAFIVRLVTSSTLLEFGFYIDPAVLVLIITLLLSLIILLATAILRWKGNQIQIALAQQIGDQAEEQRRFIHRLDHELKNPLTAIQVQLDNLQEGESGQNSSIEGVRAQANRLTLLTRGLRRLSNWIFNAFHGLSPPSKVIESCSYWHSEIW
jgi:signal transduction histidine kinase